MKFCRDSRGLMVLYLDLSFTEKRNTIRISLYPEEHLPVG